MRHIELITHNLIAVVIQILCFRYLIFPWNIIFTIIFAYLSHLIVDALSKITYHTPDAHTDDKFWLIWHIIIYSLSLISIIIFFIPFWLGMLFANIIDVTDWFILRPLRKKRLIMQDNTSGQDLWWAHGHADWIREKLLFWLPDWRFKYAGISIEIIVIIIFSVTIYFIL